MHTPRLSLVASPSATVPLRFDDPDFLAALERDGADPDKAGALAGILGVKKATDYPVWRFSAEGWILDAREAITGDEEDAILNASQKAGGGMDLAAVNRLWWATWVRSVRLPDGEEVDAVQAAVLRQLSSRSPKDRGEAFGKLPTVIRDGFRARLRAHIDVVDRPADRDPDKTMPRPGAVDELGNP